MTFEEIKRIRENPTTESCDIKELHEMIDIALEKQIPKKPIIHGVRDRDINTISYTCPICNKHIWITEDYCKHCGQALDWSDEE
ncbi:MAG: hypothetical protein II304_10605 [Bacteroidales bacterium]|nr:hypothetical protein [Bacteroidales bacterium]